jgi:hypothetical protein
VPKTPDGRKTLTCITAALGALPQPVSGGETAWHQPVGKAWGGLLEDGPIAYRGLGLLDMLADDGNQQPQGQTKSGGAQGRWMGRSGDGQRAYCSSSPPVGSNAVLMACGDVGIELLFDTLSGYSEAILRVSEHESGCTLLTTVP